VGWEMINTELWWRQWY